MSSLLHQLHDVRHGHHYVDRERFQLLSFNLTPEQRLEFPRPALAVRYRANPRRRTENASDQHAIVVTKWFSSEIPGTSPVSRNPVRLSRTADSADDVQTRVRGTFCELGRIASQQLLGHIVAHGCDAFLEDTCDARDESARAERRA